MAPATTTPTPVDRPIIPVPADEPERIALRSTLPSLPTKPALEPPKPLPPEDLEAEMRNRFADLAKPEPAKKPEPKNRLPAEPSPAKSVKPAKPAKDRDLDRANFPNRAMVPELCALILASAAWLMAVTSFVPEPWQTDELLIAVPGTYGLFVLVRWLFRIIGGGYRLTKTQLLRINAGPIPDPAPLELAQLASVKADQSAFDWFIAVGTVTLSFERDVHPKVVLGPIGWPRRRAKLIDDAAKAAREGTVVGGRVAA